MTRAGDEILPSIRKAVEETVKSELKGLKYMGVEITSDSLKKYTETNKRNCGNCKWWADNEVCVNGHSDQVADFTDKDFSCDCHEFKENDNNATERD